MSEFDYIRGAYGMNVGRGTVVVDAKGRRAEVLSARPGHYLNVRFLDTGERSGPHHPLDFKLEASA